MHLSACVRAQSRPTEGLSRSCTNLRAAVSSRSMEALVRHLGGILGSAVVTKTVSGVSASGGLKKNARKHSGHRLWPVDTRELIPLGLEQSVKGYTLSFQLCRHASFPDTLLVVNQLISIFGGLVLRFILVTEPEWPLRISVLGIGVISERSDTRGHPVRLEMETSWRHTIGVILLFAQTVAGEGHRYPHDVGQFSCRIVRTWEQDGITRQGNGGLLYVCNMLLENLPSFREGTTLFTEVLMTRLTLLASANAAILYCYRMAKEEELSPYHPEILRLRTEVNAMMEDPTYFAFGWYCYASELRHCCAPGCNETFTTLGRPFARCTGCRVVRYCSRDCQKRGWRDTRAPHKDVCAKLRMLRERTNFSQDKIADRAGDYVPFVAACKADKESEAVAFASAKHLYKLAMMRQDTDVHCVPEAYKAMFAEWKNGAK